MDFKRDESEEELIDQQKAIMPEEEELKISHSEKQKKSDEHSQLEDREEGISGINWLEILDKSKP